ncbi:MAG TPA: LamG domain-containing protein [Thermoleophilaceae bacterium]
MRALWHLDSGTCPPASFSVVRGGGFCTPDSSGNGLDGTPGSAPNTTGRFGSAYDFASSALTIAMPSSPLLAPPAVTVIAWVRNTGALDPDTWALARGGNGDCATTSYGFLTGHTGDPGAGGLGFSVLSGSTAYRTAAAAPGVVWDGNWHMAAGTFDGATARFYIDGAEVGSGTAVPGPINYALARQDMKLGAVPADAGGCDNTNHYDGSIDEVQVYSRALTQTELGRMAASPGPPTLVPDAPPSGGAGGTTLPPPPTPKIADALAVGVKRAFWFSSLPTRLPIGVTIKRVQWDFNNDGKYEASCGGNTPAVIHPFTTAGTKTIGMLVTDNFGRAVATKTTVTLGSKAINTFSRMSSIYMCDTPAPASSFTNQPSRADCIKSFHFAIVDVNARGGANQCFTVDGRFNLAAMNKAFAPKASAATTILTGYIPPRGIDLRASISGPVAINGLPVPLPSSVTSRYDGGTFEIAAGIAPLVFQLPTGGQVRAQANLSLVVRVLGGKFPLAPLKASGTASFAGLKLGGGVDVTWIDSASLVNVWVKLPNFLSDTDNQPLQGAIRLKTSNQGGFELTDADISVPSAMIGPLGVHNLFFKYTAQPGGDLLQSGANFDFPGGAKIDAAPPPAGHGIGFRGGNFDYAGLGFDFPEPRPEIFPGVELKHIDGTFANNPVRFTGGIGVTAAGILDIDGSLFMAFANSGQPYTFPAGQAPPGLKFIEGKRIDSFSVAIGGQSYLLVPVLHRVPLADAHIYYSYPDYFELGGDFHYSAGLLSADGNVDGWAAVGAGRFNLEGRLDTCAGFDVRVPIAGRISLHVCEFVSGIVSSRGIGACLGVRLPIVKEVSVGLGYRWGDTLPDVYLFSCGLSKYREVKPAGAGTAQAGARSFTLPKGLPSAQVRVLGQSGVPAVTITEPGGDKIVIPTDESVPPTGKDFVDMPQAETNTSYIALSKPKAGRYTVTASPGSPAIRGVAVANGLRTPKVRARVTGHAHNRVLHYSTARVAGQSVTFVEQGSQTYRVLGRARGAHGTLRFSPGDGPKGSRKIVALVEQNGVTRYTLNVARFTAPSPSAPGRPKRLRVKRGPKKLVITWRRVGSARQYGVTLQLRNGQRFFRLTRKPHVSLPAVPAGTRATVRVRGLSATGQAGPVATKRIR